MQHPDPAVNMKALAIPGNPTLSGGWYGSWVRKEEFFWLKDMGRNIAASALVRASSENVAGGQGALRAVDGVISGAPLEPGAEWVTSGQLGGAWIELSWPSTMRIGQVNLYDRPSNSENITSGTITFSDGSSLRVGSLPVNGRVLPVLFPPKSVTWVRFTVDQAEGTATGLSEIQVLGSAGTSTANLPPHFILGPVPALESIPASQTTTVSVVAHDLDGDALQYTWSSDAGFIAVEWRSERLAPEGNPPAGRYEEDEEQLGGLSAGPELAGSVRTGVRNHPGHSSWRPASRYRPPPWR